MVGAFPGSCSSMVQNTNDSTRKMASIRQTMVEEKTSQGTWLLDSSTDTVEWSDLSPIPEMTPVPYKSLQAIQKPIGDNQRIGVCSRFTSQKQATIWNRLLYGIGYYQRIGECSSRYGMYSCWLPAEQLRPSHLYSCYRVTHVALFFNFPPHCSSSGEQGTTRTRPRIKQRGWGNIPYHHAMEKQGMIFNRPCII